MEYTKIDESTMEQTIVPAPIKIVHDYDDLIKRRQEAQDKANEYTAIVADFDKLLLEMEKLGCCEKAEILIEK